MIKRPEVGLESPASMDNIAIHSGRVLTGLLFLFFFYNLGDANICRVMNSSQILVEIFGGLIKYSCCDVHKNVTFLQ